MFHLLTSQLTTVLHNEIKEQGSNVFVLRYFRFSEIVINCPKVLRPLSVNHKFSPSYRLHVASNAHKPNISATASTRIPCQSSFLSLVFTVTSYCFSAWGCGCYSGFAWVLKLPVSRLILDVRLDTRVTIAKIVSCYNLSVRPRLATCSSPSTDVVQHDGMDEPGDTIAHFDSDTCTETFQFSLDNFVTKILYITVTGDQSGNFPTPSLFDPTGFEKDQSGEAFSGTKQVTYYWNIYGSVKGYYTLKVSTERETLVYHNLDYTGLISVAVKSSFPGSQLLQLTEVSSPTREMIMFNYLIPWSTKELPSILVWEALLIWPSRFRTRTTPPWPNLSESSRKVMLERSMKLLQGINSLVFWKIGI